MATIINTLEVVIDQPAGGGAPQPPAPKPSAPPMTPRELEDVIERQARHVLRLAAH